MASESIEYFFKTDQSSDAVNCIKTTKAKKFGLCDKAGNKQEPAYINEDNKQSDQWIANVCNPNTRKIDFYAIDHCILLVNNGKRCDCMLYISNNQELVFVELKMKRKRWFREGAEQIIATLEHLQKESLGNISSIRAFVANKFRPNTNSSRRETTDCFEAKGQEAIKKIIDNESCIQFRLYGKADLEIS